jgi:hypothetical protein
MIQASNQIDIYYIENWPVQSQQKTVEDFLIKLPLFSEKSSIIQLYNARQDCKGNPEARINPGRGGTGCNNQIPDPQKPSPIHTRPSRNPRNPSPKPPRDPLPPSTSPIPPHIRHHNPLKHRPSLHVPNRSTSTADKLTYLDHRCRFFVYMCGDNGRCG